MKTDPHAQLRIRATRALSRLLKVAQQKGNADDILAACKAILGNVDAPPPPAPKPATEDTDWITQMLPDEEAEVNRLFFQLDALRTRVRARLADPNGARQAPPVYPPAIRNETTGSSRKKQGSSPAEDEEEEIEILPDNIPVDQRHYYELVEVDDDEETK